MKQWNCFLSQAWSPSSPGGCFAILAPPRGASGGCTGLVVCLCGYIWSSWSKWLCGRVGLIRRGVQWHPADCRAMHPGPGRWSCGSCLPPHCEALPAAKPWGPLHGPSPVGGGCGVLEMFSVDFVCSCIIEVALAQSSWHYSQVRRAELKILWPQSLNIRS